MEDMITACRKYAKNVVEMVEAYYNGITNEEGEEVGLYDYFAESLYYEAILSSNKILTAVRVYVTLGGPACWIDTECQAVVCVWGADRAEYPIDGNVCDELEEIVAECMELER